jgi:hypothetical protein
MHTKSNTVVPISNIITMVSARSSRLDSYGAMHEMVQDWMLNDMLVA